MHPTRGAVSHQHISLPHVEAQKWPCSIPHPRRHKRHHLRYLTYLALLYSRREFEAPSEAGRCEETETETCRPEAMPVLAPRARDTVDQGDRAARRYIYLRTAPAITLWGPDHGRHHPRPDLLLQLQATRPHSSPGAQAAHTPRHAGRRGVWSRGLHRSQHKCLAATYGNEVRVI